MCSLDRTHADRFSDNLGILWQTATAVFSIQPSTISKNPTSSHLTTYRPNMATPTPVDQTVQRDQPPPDQADTPGSTHNQDLAAEADDNTVVNGDSSASSGPDTPDVTAEFSVISLSLSSSSSSPHTSSTEDSPQEASSPSASDYDSDSSEEE